MKRVWWSFVVLLLAATWAVAQGEAPAAPQATPKAAPDAGPARSQRRIERKEIRIMRGPGGGRDVMFFRQAGFGKWWKDAALVKELGISDAQVQQMEKIFVDYRLRLVDAKGSLEKAEIQLDPMMDADRPDETAILAQIDKVAAARAELEKTNARMNLAIRSVLSADQWKKLQSKQGEARSPKMFFRYELPAPPPGAPDPPPLPPDED